MGARMGRLIEMRGVDVDFGTSRVLSHIDFAIDPGEIVTVIGPNGAGKTTLLRVALGAIRPHGGTVERAPGLVIGYVPQRIHVDPVMPMTVDRVMALTGRPDAGAVARRLAAFEVTHLRRRQLVDLSGGELQRVMLARAMARAPGLLVLDEPTQGMDVGGQASFYALIRRVRDETGCGVVLVSHDLHVVMRATDKVVCLNHHVCCTGTATAVARHPEYRRLFGPADARELAMFAHDIDHHRHEHGAQDGAGSAETHQPGAQDHGAPDHGAHDHGERSLP
ncbi:MAG: ATP-binding cassette domain-containing protein [Azospirillaceae bacterium]